jgi:hypothetical protein
MVLLAICCYDICSTRGGNLPCAYAKLYWTPIVTAAPVSSYGTNKQRVNTRQWDRL